MDQHRARSSALQATPHESFSIAPNLKRIRDIPERQQCFAACYVAELQKVGGAQGPLKEPKKKVIRRDKKGCTPEVTSAPCRTQRGREDGCHLQRVSGTSWLARDARYSARRVPAAVRPRSDGLGDFRTRCSRAARVQPDGEAGVRVRDPSPPARGPATPRSSASRARRTFRPRPRGGHMPRQSGACRHSGHTSELRGEIATRMPLSQIRAAHRATN